MYRKAEVFIFQVYFVHVIPLLQHIPQTVQTFHLEVFVWNEPIQGLQIYDWSVPTIFFADQKQTADKLLKWSPFPALPSLPDLLVFVVLDLTLIPLEPFPVLDSLEKKFGNLLKPRVLGLLSIVSKLGEIPLSSLLGLILEFFVWKITFLELDGQELIPPCLS